MGDASCCASDFFFTDEELLHHEVMRAWRRIDLKLKWAVRLWAVAFTLGIVAVSISWASEIVENRNRIKALEHQLIINQP